MTLTHKRRLTTGAALFIQTILLCACAVQAQPVANAMNENEAAVGLMDQVAVNLSPIAEASATDAPPTPTASLDPTATEPPPTLTPTLTPTLEPPATVLPTPTPVAAAPLEGAALIEALREGGYVLYFRHAATDRSQSDTSSIVDFQDCSTQRNLTEEGRAEALAIGESIIVLGIPVGQVWSSAYCRTLDTAMLTFGQAQVSEDLTVFPTAQSEVRVAALREMLSTPPPAGTNTALVAHELNIANTAGITLAEGEAAVFTPLGAGNFALTARILPGDWAKFHEQSPGLLLDEQAADPNLLLPDLLMLPPSDLMTLTNSDTGDRQLKFSTSIQNNGPGAAEIWGHSDATSQKTIVVQHIQSLDGSVKKVVVGEFGFHPEHDHFHFGNFARYEVWTMDAQGQLGSLVSITDKVSYCLRDDEQADLPGVDSEQTYLGCNQQRQGISPGWIDVYKFELFGQTVDISDLADGYYALINYVDPDRQLWELDQENNAAMVFFQLEDGRVRVVDYEEVVCQASICAE